MNFDAKLTKEQEELMFNINPELAVMHVDPLTGRSSYFPFHGCRPVGPATTRLRLDFSTILTRGHKDNYKPRRPGQKRKHRY